MASQTLSKQALQVIENYRNLSIGKNKILCPYFNNRRSGVRGALRVLIGKGSPKDIEEETLLFALREKVDLDNLNSEKSKKFLVDHNLGIDCSGFIYHILDAELGNLKKHLKHPWIKNPLRKLIAKLRIVENTGVSTFNNDVNTAKVKLSEVKPGDLIIMMNTGLKNDLHHILIVHEVSENQIKYSHSFQFTTDGQYNHGIKQGEIKIIDSNKNILEQEWREVETHNHAKMAKELKIKRVK
ncbi:MAG: hypothetical protein HOA57_03460 [Candidatus Magasanikbacteria bacterium]|mgnify:FL=1|jgi:hypothetical protein|nr:hypothetical protein [Candidatus Magasanikbacteria bacterium]MBT4314747.1 hypothetical protein [Candidatus Magasanikbacteria bacterium]MBT4547524.1 hypothetical protein [Candidatus Magasanikbacteria bacterium]MBT6819410.1 hypothetical protein [Candidatus Magasanikbacteria bacterium]